jgi:anti-sigma B factor antagonist
MDDFEVLQADSPNGSRILTLKGALTLKVLFEFQTLLRQQTAHNLIVDLTNVSYMDSAGLGAILGAYASCERHGRKFAVAGVSDRVHTLFEVAGVGQMLPQFASVDAAEKQLLAAK